MIHSGATPCPLDGAGTLPWRPDFARAGAAAPAFASVAHWAARLESAPTWPDPDRLSQLAIAAGIANAHGLPIRFAPQETHCGQLAYEAGILASGRVPTRRENWHDLLNALVWLSFPHAKAALNQLQCAVLPASQGGRRPPLADAATLFDESGLLLLGADASLFDLLRRRQWHAALWTRREDWRQARAYVLGHAVLEKLLRPYPGITAKCLALALPAGVPLPDAGAAVPEWLDRRLAQCWRDGLIQRPADLFPLPVAGIPGWWPENGQAGFYDRRDIFRPNSRHAK
jgi:hypothetical protein